MAKRFTESAKWSDKWFRGLDPLFKLAWMYLLDNCDLVGVIDLDRELASFQIGTEVDWEAFLTKCGEGRLRELKSGKWLVVRFCEFQYSRFSEKSTLHKRLFLAAKSHGIANLLVETGICPKSFLDKDRGVSLSTGSDEALIEPKRHGHTHEVWDMDMDKDKEKEEGGVGEEGDDPFSAIEDPGLVSAARTWVGYKTERREFYKPVGLKSLITRIVNLASAHGAAKVIAQIERAMANGWKGFDQVDAFATTDGPKRNGSATFDDFVFPEIKHK